MTPRRSMLAAALAAVAVLAVSCGGDDEPTGTGTASSPTASGTSTASGGVPDACTVMTNAEIQAIIGKDPGTGTTQKVVASRSVCTYSSGVTFGVSEGNQFDMTIQAGQSAGFKYEDVTGVGDRAKFAVVSGSVAQMMAVKGAFMIDINMALIDGDKDKTKQALAKWSTAAFAKLG